MGAKMNLKRGLLCITIWLFICGLAGLAAASFFGLNFWVTFSITAVALMLNGIVAEIEDRLPGGFLNPRKKTRAVASSKTKRVVFDDMAG
jgi:hypothetical protein